MNLASIIEAHPQDRHAFVTARGPVSYGELRARCGAMRRFLVSEGVSAGDRIAIVAGATPGFAVAYLATVGLGAVAVPLNPHSPPAELERELAAVGARLVLVALSGDSELAADLDGLGDSRRVVTIEAAEQAGALGAGAVPAVVSLAPETEAVLLFTSGTAGAPKAAVLSHDNLLANIEQVECRIGLAATRDDVGILAVPPFHILGLNAVLGVQLYAGASLLLLEHFDPGAMLEAIASAGVSLLAGVPQLFAELAAFPDATGDELSTVRLACSGAAPLSQETARAFEERYHVPLYEGYGLTEASPTVTFPDLSVARKPGSVGIPLPGVEVRIVDDDGEEVEPGDPGEILVRGPNVFAGYLDDEKATRRALDRAGWLHTGDVGVMDEDGALSIVDRKKDLVIVSGFNVYPSEVEEVLTSHPLVAEAGVVGLADEARGEVVHAYVVPVASSWPPGSPEPAGLADELIEHCETRLARYKCPVEVRLVRVLPRGADGSLRRRSIA